MYHENTPLIIATFRGDLEMVELLLAHGVEVDRRGRESGMTAYMHACERGYADIAQRLYEYGADPIPINWEGRSAYHLCSRADVQELVKRHMDFTADHRLFLK
jgi:ankyrin repeat protein